jgi:hypothetical protein
MTRELFSILLVRLPLKDRLDRRFEANVFTTQTAGVSDQAQLTVTGANCGLQTIGTVRVVLEPKPGLPTMRATGMKGGCRGTYATRSGPGQSVGQRERIERAKPLGAAA